MGPAADLDDAAALVETVVPAVGIGLELPAKIGEKRRRAVALMRRRGVEDDLPGERIQIGPDPSFETVAAFIQHRDGRVVGLEIIGGHHLAAQMLADRRQGGRDVGDPAA